VPVAIAPESMIEVRQPAAVSMVSRLLADLKPGVCDAPLRGCGV
jgi:hypothetical protein